MTALRCKPGDLAMYVGPIAESRGRVVLVVAQRPGRPGEWEVDPPLAWVPGFSQHHARDVNLRPLRPGRGEDEMLRIAGKPTTTHEPQTAEA